MSWVSAAPFGGWPVLVRLGPTAPLPAFAEASAGGQLHRGLYSVAPFGGWPRDAAYLMATSLPFSALR